MLTAKKSKAFETIFAIYCRNLFKRRFHAFHVLGVDLLKARNETLPTIIYCNHSSWWDGLVAFQLSRAVSADSFVMMEEKQLKNLKLFRRLGAFSVIRENPREAVKSINYGVSLLKEKRDRVLWIFPQGEILPNDERPVKFFNGISHIIEKTGRCLVVSIAMRYEFLGEYKPEIFVKINKPEIIEVDKSFNSKKSTLYFENRLLKTLDDLKKDVITGKIENYQRLI